MAIENKAFYLSWSEQQGFSNGSRTAHHARDMFRKTLSRRGPVDSVNGGLPKHYHVRNFRDHDRVAKEWQRALGYSTNREPASEQANSVTNSDNCGIIYKRNK